MLLGGKVAGSYTSLEQWAMCLVQGEKMSEKMLRWECSNQMCLLTGMIMTSKVSWPMAMKLFSLPLDFLSDGGSVVELLLDSGVKIPLEGDTSDHPEWGHPLTSTPLGVEGNWQGISLEQEGWYKGMFALRGEKNLKSSEITWLRFLWSRLF